MIFTIVVATLFAVEFRVLSFERSPKIYRVYIFEKIKYGNEKYSFDQSPQSADDGNYDENIDWLDVIFVEYNCATSIHNIFNINR